MHSRGRQDKKQTAKQAKCLQVFVLVQKDAKEDANKRQTIVVVIYQQTLKRHIFTIFKYFSDSTLIYKMLIEVQHFYFFFVIIIKLSLLKKKMKQNCDISQPHMG